MGHRGGHPSRSCPPSLGDKEGALRDRENNGMFWVVLFLPFSSWSWSYNPRQWHAQESPVRHHQTQKEENLLAEQSKWALESWEREGSGGFSFYSSICWFPWQQLQLWVEGRLKSLFLVKGQDSVVAPVSQRTSSRNNVFYTVHCI